MNEDRVARLSALFQEPPTLSEAEAFTASVLDQVARRTRRRRHLWWALDALAIVMVWLLAEPLQAAVQAFLPWLMAALVDAGDGVLGQTLAPVNNLASVLALVYLLGRSAYRRLLQ